MVRRQKEEAGQKWTYSYCPYIKRTNMNNLWWAYTTCTLIPMQELRCEEGGGLIIHVGVYYVLYGSFNLWTIHAQFLRGYLFPPTTNPEWPRIGISPPGAARIPFRSRYLTYL